MRAKLPELVFGSITSLYCHGGKMIAYELAHTNHLDEA